MESYLVKGISFQVNKFIIRISIAEYNECDDLEGKLISLSFERK